MVALQPSNLVSGAAGILAARANATVAEARARLEASQTRGKCREGFAVVVSTLCLCEHSYVASSLPPPLLPPFIDDFSSLATSHLPPHPPTHPPLPLCPLACDPPPPASLSPLSRGPRFQAAEVLVEPMGSRPLPLRPLLKLGLLQRALAGGAWSTTPGQKPCLGLG